MAIQFVGGASAGKVGATSGTSTIALDSGLTGGIASAVAANDLVIAVFGTGATADRTLSITDGTTEYTQFGTEQYSNDGFDTNLRVAYKFMAGTPDTATTFGPTGNTADAGAMAVYVFRGVDTTTPNDVAVQAVTGIDTSRANPPSITPVTAGAFPVCIGAAAHNGGIDTFTSGDLTSFLTNGGANDTNDVTIGIGHIDNWTSGAFDAAAFGHSQADALTFSWAAKSIVLRPGAAAYDRAAVIDSASAFDAVARITLRRDAAVSSVSTFATVATEQDITETIFAADATDHDVGMPATVNAGDLLLCIITNDGSATVTTPSGWTELYTQAQGTVVRGGAYAKVAVGDEDGTTVNFVTSAAEQAAAQVFRVTRWFGALAGIEVGTPVAITNTGVTTTDPPGVTASWGAEDNRFIAALHLSSGASVNGGPTDYYGLRETNEAQGTASGAVFTTQQRATSASSDPDVWTFSTTGVASVANNIVIRPAAAGVSRDAAIVSASTFAAVASITRGRAAVVASASTFTAASAVTRNRAAVIASGSTFTAERSVAKNRIAAIGSTSIFGAVASITRARAAVISSASAFAAVGSRTLRRAADIASASTFAAIGSVAQNRAASIVSATTFTATRGLTAARTALMVSASTLAATATMSHTRAAVMASASAFAAVGYIGQARSASIASVSAFTALSRRTYARAASIASETAFTVAGSVGGPPSPPGGGNYIILARQRGAR